MTDVPPGDGFFEDDEPLADVVSAYESRTGLACCCHEPGWQDDGTYLSVRCRMRRLGLGHCPERCEECHRP